MDTQHPGKHALCLPLHYFLVQRRWDRTHPVFVFPPAACNAAEMTAMIPPRLGMVQLLMRNVLLALDFLHTEVRCIHTDIKANNILITLPDFRYLHAFVQELKEMPPFRKGSKRNNNLVYESRWIKNLAVKG